MRRTQSLMLALFFALIPAASHADTIDDFTYTSATHTITYSLPATSSFEDHNLFAFFPEITSATIDGVSGYSVDTYFYIIPNFGYVAILYGIPNISMLELSGPTFFTYTAVPANNPYPYLPYDIVPTFTPGIYALRAASNDPFFPAPIPYTLTITPEVAATPEPSTLILLATGTLALFSRRKL